jgi:Mg-chelatase subunit ChlD
MPNPALKPAPAAPARIARVAMRVLPALLVLGLAAAADIPAATAQSTSEAYSKVATWRSTAAPAVSGLFKGPWGVDVGADGRIYVADAALGAVHVLAADGTPLFLWDGGADGLGKPRDVAVSAAAVYVSDPEADRIHVLAPDGSYRTAWSLAGQPGGLAFDANRNELYTTLLASRQVAVLDPSGAVKRRWDSGSTAMDEPWGIAVGPNSRVYVSDIGPDTRSVLVFDSDGVLQSSLAVNADGVQQAPLDAAVDSDGDVYIITELHLARFHLGQQVSQAIAAPGGRGIAAGPGSGLIVAVQDFRLGFTGLRHYRDRRAVSPTVDSWGGPFAALGALEGPRRISANRDQRVFVLDTWPRVQSWNTDGTPRTQFGAGGLHDIAAGLRGSAYAISGRRMGFWPEDGAGGAVWTWEPPSTDPAVGNPYSWLTIVDSFDLNGIGNTALVMDMGDQRFYALDYSGNPVSEWPVAPPEGFESIADAALAEGRVYLINRNKNSVEARRLDDGRLITAWTVPGSAIRIDAGSDGHFYVLNREGWVWKYAPDGVLRAVWPATEGAPPVALGHLPATDIAAGEGGRVYVSLGEAGEIREFAPDPLGKPHDAPPLADRCTLLHDKTAAPSQVTLGDSVEIRLSIEGECPLTDGRSDILLLVDTSGSMGGGKMTAARTAALEFVGQLDYSLNQVGLITFSTDVRLVQPLTNNPRALIRAIPTLGDDSGTNMLGAVQLAREEFAGPRARSNARKAIILLTDGRPNSGQTEIQSLADEFRRTGLDMYAIGLGLDVDRIFLTGIATASNYYFEAPTEYDLVQVYSTIARRVAAAVLLEQATVTDVLPADMRYRENSAVPPARYDAATRTLTWTLGSVPSGGLHLRFRVEPQLPGHHPTNVRAQADFVDGLSKPGQRVFPVPEIDVIAPTRWTAFLPILYKQKCPEVRTDVALVIDTSSSMREPTRPGGPSKLDAAVQAARVFIGQLRLPQDRVAIVAFNGSAQIVQPLTGDALRLVRAMDGLPNGTGTRIDLGLGAGVDALARPAPDHLPVVVLLTDGNQSGGDLDQAVARARAAGIRIFTVGLGGDVNREVLIHVAGDARRAYFAPLDADLADIYRTIASEIPCEG